MLSISTVALAFLTAVVKAQDVTINVGLNGLSYTPSNVSVPVGSYVNFIFHPKNHIVTRSSFDSPCTKLLNPQGVPTTTGFVPVADDATELPYFRLLVQEPGPFWFYCGQTNPKSHCAAGMVGAINADPNSDKSFAAFQANALASQSGSSSAVSSASVSQSWAPIGSIVASSSSIAATATQATQTDGSGVSGTSTSGTPSASPSNGAVSLTASHGLVAGLLALVSGLIL